MLAVVAVFMHAVQWTTCISLNRHRVE